MQLTAIALGLVVAVLGSSALFVQTEGKKRFTHPMPDNQEAAMQRWMDTWKLGPPHERLAELVGKYETTSRMWMAGPDAKPTESKGTAEISWLHEGRWLQCKWQGEMMGMKLGGTWWLGYDNFKQRYVATFVDNFQTCMSSAMGLFDAKGDDLFLWGTIDEPMTPEQDKQVKYVYRGFGADTLRFEVHDMMIGESNTRVVEVEYARKR